MGQRMMGPTPIKTHRKVNVSNKRQGMPKKIKFTARQVAETMLLAYQHVDTTVAKAVAEYAKGGHVSECKAGCSECCHIRTVATLPEVLTIAVKYPDVVAEVEQRAIAQAEVQRSGITAREWLGRHEPCVFLGTEGRCRVYDARPLVCRQYTALTPASYCAMGADTAVVTIDFQDMEKSFYGWVLENFGDGWGGGRGGVMPSMVSDALRLARGGVYRRTQNQDRAESQFWTDVIEATSDKEQHYRMEEIVQIKSRATKLNAEKGT